MTQPAACYGKSGADVNDDEKAAIDEIANSLQVISCGLASDRISASQRRTRSTWKVRRRGPFAQSRRLQPQDKKKR
jgi:hypothetical protein